MACEECKKSDKMQKLADEIIGLTEEEITNLNCIIAGNKLELMRL